MGVQYEISVIVPFGDDEDLIGTAIQRVADHLRQTGLPFEILAVDEASGDNSHAVLALLRASVPELRVIHAPGRGRGTDAGASRAQGKLLWIVEPELALGNLGLATPAFSQVRRNEVDAVVIHAHYVIANRLRALPALAGLRGSGDARRRRLARRLASRGLRVDVQMMGAAPRATRPRLLSLFTARRDERAS